MARGEQYNPASREEQARRMLQDWYTRPGGPPPAGPGLWQPFPQELVPFEIKQFGEYDQLGSALCYRLPAFYGSGGAVSYNPNHLDDYDTANDAYDALPTIRVWNPAGPVGGWLRTEGEFVFPGRRGVCVQNHNHGDYDEVSGYPLALGLLDTQLDAQSAAYMSLWLKDPQTGTISDSAINLYVWDWVLNPGQYYPAMARVGASYSPEHGKWYVTQANWAAVGCA